MRFVAIDVETANADMSSICALGAVEFDGSEQRNEFYSIIDPVDFFDPINVGIHGIDECATIGAPTFDEIFPEFLEIVQDKIIVSHTHFDRVAIHRASERYGRRMPDCQWLDTARVARRVWSDCAHRGYGLRDLCARIGFDFKHHNALADAKASAQILISAMSESGLDLEGLLTRAKQPLHFFATDRPRLSGNPSGSLFGEVVVFTGTLAVPRLQAARMAAAAGCDVAPSVTQKTTILVVGEQDARSLSGHERSLKHRKAEDLIRNGFGIRIISEPAFMRLLALD